jgi:hypothetical protein
MPENKQLLKLEDKIFIDQKQMQKVKLKRSTKPFFFEIFL